MEQEATYHKMGIVEKKVFDEIISSYGQNFSPDDVPEIAKKCQQSQVEVKVAVQLLMYKKLLQQ
jgi:hypothetical protein